MTLFPEMIEACSNTSIIKRGVENNLINIKAVNIRDYTLDKHNKVDDYPYGGGAGMLMQAQPVYDCYKAIEAEIMANTGSDSKPKVLFMSPQGKTFNQKHAQEYAKEDNLILLCGHYEGIDERVLEKIVDEEISIGDFVLTGGELPAMTIIDCISRLVPGVLHNEGSAGEESFENDLLEYPQYTRPEEWMGERVPDVLLSGHHANIAKWRKDKSIERTKNKRPDLYERYINQQ